MKEPRVPVNENMGSGTGIGTFTPTCNVNVLLSMAKKWLKFRKGSHVPKDLRFSWWQKVFISQGAKHETAVLSL